MKHIAIAAAFLALTFALDARAADAKPPPKGKAKATPAQIQAVKTAKAGFMAAMGSCPRPENCDPASKDKNPELVKMLQGAEDQFMEACAQCATDAACAEERTRIREGRGRFGFNVCAPPPPAKPATAPAVDKKSAAPSK